MLTFADVADEHRLGDAAQIQERAIALHLAVEGRLAVCEDDGETQPGHVELARRGHVGDEKLRLDSGQHNG